MENFEENESIELGKTLFLILTKVVDSYPRYMYNNDDLAIYIPRYAMLHILSYLNSTYSCPIKTEGKQFFMGIEVLPSYTNQIVLCHKDYSLYRNDKMISLHNL